MQFTNRKVPYPNRVKLTKVPNEIDLYDIVRTEGVPEVEGTPLNAATFNQFNQEITNSLNEKLIPATESKLGFVQLPTSTSRTNGVVRYVSLASGTNLNNLRSPGEYVITTTITSGPSGLTFGTNEKSAIIKVISTSDTRVTQIIYHNNGSEYRRELQNTTWTTWNIPSPFNLLWDWEKTAGLSAPPTLSANYNMPITLALGKHYKLQFLVESRVAEVDINLKVPTLPSTYAYQGLHPQAHYNTNAILNFIVLFSNTNLSQIANIYRNLAYGSTATVANATITTDCSFLRIIEVVY